MYGGRIGSMRGDEDLFYRGTSRGTYEPGLHGLADWTTLAPTVDCIVRSGPEHFSSDLGIAMDAIVDRRPFEIAQEAGDILDIATISRFLAPRGHSLRQRDQIEVDYERSDFAEYISWRVEVMDSENRAAIRVVAALRSSNGIAMHHPSLEGRFVAKRSLLPESDVRRAEGVGAIRRTPIGISVTPTGWALVERKNQESTTADAANRTMLRRIAR